MSYPGLIKRKREPKVLHEPKHEPHEHEPHEPKHEPHEPKHEPKHEALDAKHGHKPEHAVFAQSETAVTIDEFRDLLARFEHREINVPVLMAKVIILFGIFLLSWAKRVRAEDRLISTVKVAAVLAFCALYPWFTLAVLGGTAVIYVFSLKR